MKKGKVRIRFEDVLTFLSLRSEKDMYKVVFTGKGGKGILHFSDGEIKDIKYGKLEGEAALDALVKEGEIEISEMRKIRQSPKFKKEGKSLNYQEFLGKFRELPGYKASAIFNVNGEQVAFDAIKEPDKVKKFFRQMTSLFVAGGKAVKKTGAGGLDFIQTNSNLGKFLARKGVKFIVILLLEEEGNIALAKEALEKTASNI